MPRVRTRSVLSGMSVTEAMRRQVVRLPRRSAIGAAIRHLLKFKLNALLVTDGAGKPCGVISKTDLISACYAGMPLDGPIADLLAGPPRFCFADDSLESALDEMQAQGIHRLYVRGASQDLVVGTLAYTDVVGLLYRYCRVCIRGASSGGTGGGPDQPSIQKTVRDVMTAAVVSCGAGDRLEQVIEALLAHRLGALLVLDAQGAPVGVISKTDLILCYLHGRPMDAPATAVMSTPVASCGRDAPLVSAIQQMLLEDVQRLFVHDEGAERIVGVLSLSDAARFRSGSCRACTAGRLILVDTP